MKCSVCGTENEDYLLFCVMCGARLPKSELLGGADAKTARTNEPAHSDGAGGETRDVKREHAAPGDVSSTL